MAVDSTRSAKVFMDSGGDRQVVASGGTQLIESGGTVTYESGSTLTRSTTQKDSSGDIELSDGATIPADATTGYAIGSVFRLNNATTGMCAEWRNHGTTTSCAFRPVGPVIAYGVNFAGGPETSAGGDTAETIAAIGMITADDISFVEHEVSDDSDQIVAQIAGDGFISITGSADPATAHGYAFALLRSGCVPEWDIVAAGTVATAGGAAAEAITVAGVETDDIAFASLSATDDTDVISDVVCTANTVTVTLSADPSTTHGLHYVVYRPRGSFKPSHYVFAAGVFTTIGGDAVEVITATGAAATDVAIVHWNTTDDTDTIVKSVMTANTLTVTLSADPSTAHKLAYKILRAYS